MACWVNFIGKCLDDDEHECLREDEQMLSDYNVWKYICPNVHISGRKLLFTIFTLKITSW